MKSKSTSIGSFEAKTHLSRLIDEVQNGGEFIITKRGKPLAKLVRYKETDEHMKLSDVVEQFDEIRNSVKGKVDIEAYIREGRKY